MCHVCVCGGQKTLTPLKLESRWWGAVSAKQPSPAQINKIKYILTLAEQKRQGAVEEDSQPLPLASHAPAPAHSRVCNTQTYHLPKMNLFSGLERWTTELKALWLTMVIVFRDQIPSCDICDRQAHMWCAYPYVSKHSYTQKKIEVLLSRIQP